MICWSVYSTVVAQTFTRIGELLRNLGAFVGHIHVHAVVLK